MLLIDDVAVLHLLARNGRLSGNKLFVRHSGCPAPARKIAELD